MDIQVTQQLRRDFLFQRKTSFFTSLRLLWIIAVSFIGVGTLTLYLATPTPSLTPYHLGALMGGWLLAWGGSAVLLHIRLPKADLDYLPILALLTGWGLLLLARLAPGFLLRQIRWLCISCGALCGTALYTPLPRLLRRYRYTLLTGGILLLGMTLVFGVNPSGYGQQLWLGAFGLYFQPSELLKLLLVIYLAAYLSDRRNLASQSEMAGELPIADKPFCRTIRKWWVIQKWPAVSGWHTISEWLVILGPMSIMSGLALLLLGWQQDLGAALLFYLTFVAMLYLAWGKVQHVILSLLLFLPIAVTGYIFSSRVALRVSIWLDPWAPEQADRAFQILQSLFALADGGLGGQGLGQGIPTLIPAVHTDFVYAALVEEFGLAGAMGLIALLGLLIYKGIVLAQRSESPFEALLAGGITALLGIQTWVILAGNTKLIPITGVTLPFLSYGGSSLLTLMVAMGLLLNISAPHLPPLTLTLPPAESPPLRETSSKLGRDLLLLLVTLALSTSTWAVQRAPTLRTYPTNPRRILAETRIQRGRILDRNGIRLADIEVAATGFVTRTYPIPEAAPVVGYATLTYGTSGIEASCDTRLRGEVERTDWDATWDALMKRVPQGEHVQLTLDAYLQQSAQQKLTGYQGAIVLGDVHTGEILALASAPIYDPAKVADDWDTYRDDIRSPLLNRATQGLVQPGAILETVILGTALQAGFTAPPVQPITPSITLPNGAPFLNGTVTCTWLPEEATWTNVLSATCPAPFVTLAQKLGSHALVEGFRAWGLIEAPVLEIPTVATMRESDQMTLTREALGQGELLVTPLQMVGVAAALGNDGVRVPFRLLTQPLAGCNISSVPQAVKVLEPEVAQYLRGLWPRFGMFVGHQGKALAGSNRTLEWFIGLDNVDHPHYAVAVLIETYKNDVLFQHDTELASTLQQTTYPSNTATQIGLLILQESIKP
ncbi:MAG: FtsW/RodA/SpoVE family cell cycle protein [Anaerolineae bacterium]|nr:FtsW/RodA/SpoVE family cell cycle protein [Anaerolineae bacterium]